MNQHQLKRVLEAALKSTGGRPGLEAATQRPRIPLSDQDMAQLHDLAEKLHELGVDATAPQAGAVLLSDALRVLRAGDDNPTHAMLIRLVSEYFDARDAFDASNMRLAPSSFRAAADQLARIEGELRRVVGAKP